ncbi:MAG: 50S ribosomal protein L21 [Acidobacteria bacterium]|nr:50S ribosomal protein L21 [Acidobacteriota bacterium]
MYAIIETGGKQYRVEPGDEIHVELLRGEAGETGEVGRVLAVSPESGSILTGAEIATAKVEATILGHGQERKILVFHYKAKKQYKKTRGHRQQFTKLRVDKVTM